MQLHVTRLLHIVHVGLVYIHNYYFDIAATFGLHRRKVHYIIVHSEQPRFEAYPFIRSMII